MSNECILTNHNLDVATSQSKLHVFVTEHQDLIDKKKKKTMRKKIFSQNICRKMASELLNHSCEFNKAITDVHSLFLKLPIILI